MKIDQLYYCLKTAETQSLTKAAELLYTSKQNIGEMITSLENELGVKIFNRSSKGMFLTADGEKVIEYAGEMIEIYEKMCSLKNNKKQYMLTTSSRLNAIVLPKIFESIRENLTDVQVSISDKGNMEKNIEDLYNGKTDLLLLDDSRKRNVQLYQNNAHYAKKLDFIHLCEDKVVLVAHSFLGIETYSDLLKKQVAIVNYENYGNSSKGILGLNENEYPIITVATYEMYKTMIDSALAVGLSTELLLRNQPWRYSEDILYLKNDIGLADVYSNIYLIVNKDCESDKNIQQIIQIIKAVVAAAMEK